MRNQIANKMFFSILKRTLAFGTAATLSSSFLYTADFKDSLEKLSYLKSLSTSPSPLWTQPSTLVYFYTQSEPDSQKAAIQQLQEKSSKYGYNIQKVYFEPGPSEELLLENLKISKEELDIRLTYKSNFAFINKSEVSKAPLGIPPSDIDAWVSKCQFSLIDLKTLPQFYSFCRSTIVNGHDFVLVLYDLNEEDQGMAEKFSKNKYKIPVVKIEKALADQLELNESGIYLAKRHSIYDGDFDSDLTTKLKFAKFTGEVKLDTLSEFVSKKSVPSIFYCDSLDKAGNMLNIIYTGSLRALYVLTSNVKIESERYREWVQILQKIRSKYQDQFTIVIIPNDDLARKLSLIRSKKLRNYSVPEVRFIDFSKLISTYESDGQYEITDCSSNRKLCAEIIDSHYSLKNNFDKQLTYENIEDFVEKSLKGEYKNHYETDTTPSSYVRKLCAVNFNEEVIKTDKDVLVELYGKYCPGCIGFKKSYSEVAEELNEKKDFVVAKICIDHNMVPELTNKKPHTPIFWLFKKGQKDKPLMFEGRLKKEELMEFIQNNLTQESN